ncbi:MAG TPA: aminopeptidase P family protein [Acidimicrobiales bacterium]|jgi:Xaa-Pro aminopeptidase|nr:aminopeptidase P family protein [Acidimicrobiales bacterium]
MDGALPDPARLRAQRLAAVRDAMASVGVDALCCTGGADLAWLTGYEATALERPTVLVVERDGAATLVVPALEAPRVGEDPRLFRLAPWRDGDDPVTLVADLLRAAGDVAVSDTARAGFLLALEAALPQVRWRAASSITGPLRAVKDARELAALEAAGAAADEVAKALVAGEIPLLGRTESEVAAEIGRRLLEVGHAAVNFAIVGSGPNAASPHHEPGRRRIGPGETVVCDFGGTFRLDGDVGYCSDVTRTVVTGEPTGELRDLYDAVAAAQAEALAAVRPGVPCEEIDRVGRARIAHAGYGDAFVHRIGHGIGIEAHEDPYLVAGNRSPLRAGHAFSVEPGIYLAGRLGVRIEDVVLVAEDGARLCSSADRSLRVVEA